VVGLVVLRVLCSVVGRWDIRVLSPSFKCEARGLQDHWQKKVVIRKRSH